MGWSFRRNSSDDWKWLAQSGAIANVTRFPAPFKLRLQRLNLASKVLDRDPVMSDLVFDFVKKVPQRCPRIGCFGGSTDDPQCVPRSPSQVVPTLFNIAFFHRQSRPIRSHMPR